jgi:hypothetical protein
MSLHRKRVPGALLWAVTLAFLVPKLALATDPTSLAEIIDDGSSFRFGLALRVAPNTVTVTTVYNRIAGALVDAGASTVQGVPVVAQLAVQMDAQGRFFVDAPPRQDGQPPLPDGVYSRWLEVSHVPAIGARSRAPFRERRTLYFRVVNGGVQRLTLASYSALVDPASQRKNKLGILEPAHPGVLAARQSALQANSLPLVESGTVYSTPDNSEQGQ